MFKYLILLCVGCYQPVVVDIPHVCLHYSTINDDAKLNAYDIINNENLAKHIIQPIVPDFCNEFAGTLIVFLDSPGFKCTLGGTCTGETWAWGEVFLSNDSTGLVHELFHVYETHRFVLNSYQHPQWTEKGYFDLASKFANSSDLKSPLY